MATRSPASPLGVPADRNSLSVPPELLQPGSEWELEVLALGAGGNQTIAASSFTTEYNPRFSWSTHHAWETAVRHYSPTSVSLFHVNPCAVSALR